MFFHDAMTGQPPAGGVLGPSCRCETEHFPMSQIHEAFARLQSGKAHYRIMLDADF